MTQNYLFENLGPDRFQKLCQALIHKKFKLAKSFPISQRDGGRDAIAYYSSSDGFIVFQVKFIKSPLRADRHDWLKKTIELELPKIEELIKRGAKEYYFISNIEGTAHLDTGLIDKFNTIFLSKKLNIKAYSWFRDDLKAEIDSAWEIKWAYPEILNGPDILGLLVSDRLNKPERDDTIRAYLKDQYDFESKVKFKQVEIDNNILDLFIDVPLKKELSTRGEKSKVTAFRKIRNAIKQLQSDDLDDDGCESDSPFVLNELGASKLLLSDSGQNEIPKLVLEGAPGQGKTTITQFVCQVHRIHLLEEHLHLKSRLTKSSLNIPVKIPFKIDLRDLASFINNKNPYGDQEEAWFKNASKVSLEAFMAANIRHHSGRSEFNVVDFRELSKISSILIAFDGFDEVADIDTREKIIEVISKGVSRIEIIAINLQVIVTSRPTAFSKSINFPEEIFPHFELDNLNTNQISEYAEKWMKSKRLDSRDKKTIVTILKNKLSQQHLRSLAQNPMQLAILLSLIHQQGESLPDKRTALYDDYIKKFFDRESEKSHIVRDYRELILNIHQYLAWILHTEAEMGSNGKIERDRLLSILKSYLESHGHELDILDELFDSIQERVMVIVQRTVGIYEFEVQPLREYFCAKFLYETTPYSPAGKEKQGTLPDRFDAIAQNFYWLNVVRFFAGCFSRGELPMLIERIETLLKKPPIKYTSHPRLLTSMFLSDWVFAQYPNLLSRVMKILLEGLGLRAIFSPSRGYRVKNNTLSIPEKSGRQALVETAFDLLAEFPPYDYSRELVDLINSNPTVDVIENWNQRIPTSESDKLKWLSYGYQLRIIHLLKIEKIHEYLGNIKDLGKPLRILISANRSDLIFSNNFYFENTTNAFLRDEISIFRNEKQVNTIFEFGRSLSTSLYRLIFEGNGEESLPAEELIKRYQYYDRIPVANVARELEPHIQSKDLHRKCSDYISKFNTCLGKPVKDWKTSINNWDSIIENGRSLFGERWSFYCIAAIASGITSKDQKFLDYNNLHDKSTSLCKRARCARLKVRAHKWWAEQLDNCEDELESMFCLLLIIKWSSSDNIFKNIDRIDKHIQSLSKKNFELLIKRINPFDSRGNITNLTHLSICKLSDRFTIYSQHRISEKVKSEIYIKKYTNYSGDNHFVWIFISKIIAKTFAGNPNSPNTLKQIKKIYSKGISSFSYALNIDDKSNPLSYETSKLIVDESQKFRNYSGGLVPVLTERTVVNRFP